MIITISGANFSKSNIGTLSTWTVSKSIGAGAEHNGIPSYVDKNSAFDYTITLKDGYTFGTYSVTMGGQTITPTVTETSMKIYIASVTGAIKIEVKTINSSTGEEDKPVTPEEPETGGDNISWLINGFQSDGSINNLTTRARVFVKVEDAQNATIVGNSNVKYCLYAFGNNVQTSYLGKIDGFINGEINSNIIEELGKQINDTSSIKYIGVTAAYKDNAEITDINGFGNNFTFTGVSNATIMPKNPFMGGSISSSTGELVSNSNRAYTYPFEIKNVTVTNNPGYQHIIYLYSGDAADQTCFVSKLNDWALETEISLDSIPQTTTHYRIIVKNDAGTAITPLQAYENTIIK